MGQVGLKIGGRAWPVGQAGTKKVVVTKEEKHRPWQKKKKDQRKKKKKKSEFGRHGARPHSLPKRPSGLPFGPLVRPESSFSYQL